MSVKYRYTDETIDVNGHTLHRIEAVRNFGNIKKGELGGFVESHHNLCNEGTCWIYNNAMVYGRSYVIGNSRVSDNASVSCMEGSLYIYQNAHIRENAKIRGCVYIHNNACVYGNSEVSAISLCDEVFIGDKVQIFDTAHVKGHIILCGGSRIFGDAVIDIYADILDGIEISVDHGYWNKIIGFDEESFMISSTLKKIRLI